MKGYPVFPKSSSITGTSLSDCLVSYPGHSLVKNTLLQRSSQCILQPQPTDEVPVMLELWGMQGIRLLPSLPAPLWPTVVTPDRVLSKGLTKLNGIHAKLDCLKYDSYDI